MAGLLEFLNTDQGRMGLGLLAAAGPRTDGAGFGQRMAEGMGNFDAYKQNQLKTKHAEMQMMQAQAEMEAAKQAAAMAKSKREALPGLFIGGSAALSPLVGDPALGILPSQGRPAQAPRFDAQRALMAGYTPDEIAKLDGLRNIGLDEVARTIKGMENGREVEIQVDKFGRQKAPGMEQYRAPIEMSTGDKKQLLDPYNRQPLASFAMGQSPDSKASNALGWANNALAAQGQELNNQRAVDRLAFDKQGGAESVKPKLVDGQWVTAPSNMGAGEVRPAMPSAGRKDAMEALELIKSAREIIPKSTGSYMGSAVDQVGRVFGASTGGDTAAAQLKALEGALVSKMPKMSGPQSDKDVQLYKQMAGEIGDPTIPQSRKLAALQVIEEIQNRQALIGAGQQGGASGGWGASSPPASGGGWSIQKVN